MFPGTAWLRVTFTDRVYRIQNKHKKGKILRCTNTKTKKRGKRIQNHCIKIKRTYMTVLVKIKAQVISWPRDSLVTMTAATCPRRDGLGATEPNLRLSLSAKNMLRFSVKFYLHFRFWSQVVRNELRTFLAWETKTSLSLSLVRSLHSGTGSTSDLSIGSISEILSSIVKSTLFPLLLRIRTFLTGAICIVRL